VFGSSSPYQQSIFERTRSPHHFPIPADLGFDIDDYVEFTAPARKQKNSVITKHFVGKNASVVITFTARNDPTLSPAPYTFQTSMMAANLINRCDLDILRRNLKTGRVVPRQWRTFSYGAWRSSIFVPITAIKPRDNAWDKSRTCAC
jgi:hypothetical protein